MQYISILILNTVIIIISAVLSYVSILFDSFINISGFNGIWSESIGFLILITGISFRVIASIQFYKNKISILTLKAQTNLISKGLFSFSRNPLYIGIGLIFLSSVLFAGAFSGIFLWGISFWIMDFWVRKKEEKYMEKAFPNGYKKYKEKVPRWVKFF